jgi:seryl-tRNA synthetase
MVKKYKDLTEQFKQILADRGMDAVEDDVIIQGIFNILEQADRVLRDINSQEKQKKEIEKTITVLDAKDSLTEEVLKSRNTITKTLLRLDDNLSKNRALYSRLIVQSTNLLEKFFATPNSKLNAAKLTFQPKVEASNPILDVLGGK